MKQLSHKTMILETTIYKKREKHNTTPNTMISIISAIHTRNYYEVITPSYYIKSFIILLNLFQVSLGFIHMFEYEGLRILYNIISLLAVFSLV